MTVQTLSVSFDPYIRAGWALVPIPPQTKGPILSGWNKRENCITNPEQVPIGHGVGLAHAYSSTCSIDIDDLGESTRMLAEQGIDLQALLDAPDAVQIHSGNPGHAKLIYALPFALPSKKISFKASDGQNKVAYEFRCASASGTTVQDVLPPSIHPVTLKPYQWAGKGSWQHLPPLPDALLALWQGIIDQDAERTIRNTDDLPASWEEITSALYTIPASCGNDDWVTVGMALHQAGTASGQLDQAQALYDEWSSTGGDKYKGPRDVATRWRSFKADPEGIKLGSLFHLAKQHGWVRPVPDVSHLFQSATPVTPQVLHDMLNMGVRPPKLDLSRFPSWLTTYAKEIGITRGCDPIIAIWAGMAAMSGAADARIKLELAPGYKVSPVIWVMTIGDPSDKKSPASGPLIEPLKDFEVEDRKPYKARHLMWQAQEAARAAEAKAYFQWTASADEQLANSVQPHVRELGDEPKELRLLVNDTTSAKLVQVVRGNEQGVLAAFDELSGWMRRVNDTKGPEDRAVWIAGYEAKPYTVDRVGGGTIFLDHHAVSIYGNIQPEIYRRELRRLSEDGTMQRFIPVMVDPELTRMPALSDRLVPAAMEYDLMLRRTRTLPITTYYLSDGAREQWTMFGEWYYAFRNDERLVKADSIYMTALGKLEGTVGRIACLLHIMADPYSPEVSAQTMADACYIGRRFVVPSLRYAFNELLEKESYSTWLIDRLIQTAGEVDSVTLNELRHGSRRRFKDAPQQLVDQEILGLMEVIEAHGWVTLVNNNPRRNSWKWAINPSLATLYPDHRKAVVGAKKRLRDEMAGNMDVPVSRMRVAGE